jgi:integrase
MARRTHGEGSVYMRKDGRAAASIIYEGKRITKYGRTKKEAREKLDAYLDELKQGKVVIGPKQTVKQYLENWLENSRRLKVEITTAERYDSAIRVHLVPAFGHLRLDQLTREHVQVFYAKLLNDGLAPRTIQLIHMVLSTALNDAVEGGILARNVCEKLTVPRAEKYEAHFLTRGEAQRLLAAARGHRLWLFILMAITMAPRRGELTGLRWSDIDLSGGVVHIQRTVGRVRGLGKIAKSPKTKSSFRKVRLPQVVLDGLEEQRKFIDRIRAQAGSTWQENDLVFPNKNGCYLDHWVVLRQFKKVLQEAGLPDMRFHDLRHSAATLLLAAGVNIKVVQEILGHSNINTTLMLYGHVLPDMQKEASDRMDDMFGK